MRKSTFILPAIVVIVVLLLSSIYIVDERQRALVLQFGRVVDVRNDPGLAFKLPFIQQVVRYDDRILSIDVQPLEVTPLDDRRLVVDAFARYRIDNVEQFREAVGPGGISTAESRIDSILRAQTREILGSVTSDDILSSDRAAMMLRIRDGAINDARDLGVDIVDVRLKATDLPRQNLQATFDRMRAEREREATDERARGNEAAQRVRAQADRTVVELVSDAQRQSDIIRGESDARRNAIFAQAFGQDADFFEFYRSLRAYERSLLGTNSQMVLTPDSDFFVYLKSPLRPGETMPEAEADALAAPAGIEFEETSDTGADPGVTGEANSGVTIRQTPEAPATDDTAAPSDDAATDGSD
ncbi:protease modulator HflC [Chachezhania antarctica]|uniref:protease modulator HflC n=1 Tax=Chachezhania antarctica TaxID=2340860 RepID=UPI000EB08A21|nr:protease modulator HflC [Chachezhania antarctica]|tara:strand:- start:247 stop:1317 length:1071 start_codon:yes stop_codon:yes gene_type:complete